MTCGLSCARAGTPAATNNAASPSRLTLHLRGECILPPILLLAGNTFSLRIARRTDKKLLRTSFRQFPRWRRPVSAGRDTLPRIDVLEAQRIRRLATAQVHLRQPSIRIHHTGLFRQRRSAAGSDWNLQRRATRLLCSTHEIGIRMAPEAALSAWCFTKECF